VHYKKLFEAKLVLLYMYHEKYMTFRNIINYNSWYL